MKKFNYLNRFSFLAVILAVVLTTSCSDDESNQFEGPHFASFLGLGDNISISENGGPFTVDLGITQPQDQDVTITFTLVEDTAVENVNFTISATSVTIPAGEYNGSFTITPIDDDFFNLSRRFTIEITDVSSGQLKIGNFDGFSYFRTVVLSNDDCPTQSSLWWGNLSIEDVGYGSFSGTGSANEAGDCDVLVVNGDLANAGIGASDFEFYFTPSSSGATSGTVDVPSQLYCTACSAGLDGFYSGSGTYDETTGTIIVFYSFDRSDGANFFTGTTIITIP